MLYHCARQLLSSYYCPHCSTCGVEPSSFCNMQCNIISYQPKIELLLFPVAVACFQVNGWKVLHSPMTPINFLGKKISKHLSSEHSLSQSHRARASEGSKKSLGSLLRKLVEKVQCSRFLTASSLYTNAAVAAQSYFLANRAKVSLGTQLLWSLFQTQSKVACTAH